MYQTKNDAITWLAISASSKLDSRWMVITETRALVHDIFLELTKRLVGDLRDVRKSSGNERIRLQNGSEIFFPSNTVYGPRGYEVDGCWIHGEPRDGVERAILPALIKRNAALVYS